MDHAEKYDIINLVRKDILRCYASTAVLISIHSLIRGRTLHRSQRSAVRYIFQSTPSYEGEQATICLSDPPLSISIHSLIRGRTLWTMNVHHNDYDFNPLPHTRENAETPDQLTAQNYFNPLPHTRENHLYLPRGFGSMYFNPLPHTRENKRSLPI